ncbi:MAG: tetratricopeptide repeat protein, partial [Gemmataceae bacterium]|nr:tetratricopeptide repeat protein [Gemmataceae bacterium]
MTRHGKVGLILAILLVAGWMTLPSPYQPLVHISPAAQVPEALTPEEQRERLVIERFVTVLEKNPRRGTALDRIYGYHIERGTLEELLQQYTARTQKDATDGTAWMILGLLESQRGKDAKAVTAFRQAETHLPQNALPSYYLGQSLVLVGQPDAAAEAFERGIARKPPRTELLDLFQALGRVYQRAQRTDKALAVWSRLEQYFPDDPRVQEQIASTLAEEGQLEQALPRFEKLAKEIKDRYRQSTFRIEAAELKVRLKQTPKALADLEDLLGQLNPENWLYREVRRKIEEIFLRNDDLAGLAKYYENWVQKNPGDTEAYSRLARTLAGQGRLPESRAWLEKALQRAPTRRELRQALLEQLVAEQKYGEAAAQYEAMDKHDPDNPDTLREWGKLLLRDTARPEAERKAAAVAVWKRLLNKRPKDPVTASQVADLVRTAGQTDEAIALYKKAIELAPTSAQYREYLGEYYHSLKRSEEALATWRPIAAGANRTAKNLARLAEVLAGFGYRKEALTALADALALEKDDFNLLVKYADLLHQDERHDDALAQLDVAAKLASNAEEAETVLVQQIKIYQATETLESRITGLQKELAAGQDATAARWHRLARFHEANRQIPAATTAISKALELDGKAIPILASAARIHENGGNLLLAADTNRKLAAIDRRFRTDYLTAVAKLEARLGRRAEALQAGRDLIAAAPGNPEHYKTFADLCFQVGESEEGLEALRRAIRVNPSDPQGLQTLANALADRFRIEEAVELYWRAFEKSNELEDKLGVISRLAELYLQNNQLDRLLERLERERREAEKTREMTICLAQAYQAAGDHGTARQQLERLLTENARDTGLLQQLSNLAENEGDVALAIRYQRQLVVAAPKNRDARLRLAQLLVRAGESEEAATIWVDLVADEPEPHRTLQAIDSLHTHGRHDTVLAITSRLLAQKPGNWELLYREGAALGALEQREEAVRRFQALLDLRLPDAELGEIAKYQKKQKPGRAVGTAVRTTYTPETFELQQRVENVYELRAATGLEPRYYYSMQQQQRTWGPVDYGQARLAALAWMMGFANRQNQQEAFVQQWRAARDKAASDPRITWDWYYVQILRQEQRAVYEASRPLARTGDPAGDWVYLAALANRTAVPGRTVNRRPDVPGAPDTTPPLPAEQLEQVLASYRRLRQQKPEWLTTAVINNVLKELKRAKRTEDEARVYREALAAAQQLGPVRQVLLVAGERGDVAGALQLFERLEKLQGGAKIGWGSVPTRDAADSLARVMKTRAEAKAHAEMLRLYDAYLAMHRRLRRTSPPRSTGLGSSGQQSYYMTYTGPYARQVPIDYPQPNDYFDRGAIALLRNVFEFYKRDDLVSDLLALCRERLEKSTGLDRVYHQLGLAYLHWWNQEKDEAITEMTAVSGLLPNDQYLRLEVADLHERNHEREEALAVLDSFAPLDHTTMQRREVVALRLAVRTGNVERARQAADRLFGLRLDAQTQVQLAAQMHQLGMHQAAETVLGRASRQAGNRTAALVSLMNQHQAQNRMEQAVQVARQILRRGPSLSFSPYNYYNEETAGRPAAIQLLARAGKLQETIERVEAQIKSSPKSLPLHLTLIDYYKAAGDKEKLKTALKGLVQLKPDDPKVRFQVGADLAQAGDHAGAVEHYTFAFRKEPALYATRYWEIQGVFHQANKRDELVKLIDDIDLKALGGNYWSVLQLIQPMLDTEKTREQGLKLFARVWKAFPDQREYMLGNLHQEEVWRLPETYDYLREVVLPPATGPIDPWRASEQIISWGSEGQMGCAVNRFLEVARRQNRLDALTRAVEQLLAKHSDWCAGKALLSVLDVGRGRPEATRRAWDELLADKTNPVPWKARYFFGMELENYSRMQDLVLQLYEGGVAEALRDPDLEFSNSPVQRLVKFYQQLERNHDAKALVLKFLNHTGDYYWDPGYSMYRRLNSMNTIGTQLVQLGFPADAVRIYNEILGDQEALQVAQHWGGGDWRVMAENGLQQSLKALKPGTLPRAVRDLLQPRTDPKATGPVLDLVLMVQPRELGKATMTSLLEAALRSSLKAPKLRAAVRQRCGELAAQFPQDVAVQITAALDACGDGPPEQATEAVGRLARLVEATPLEELRPGARANARQRADAARQIGLWLVARACLRREPLQAVGVKLADRAVEAARRQSDVIYGLAILREWGRMELERGDRQAAERRWAQLLELLLPAPPARKRTAVSATSQLPSARGGIQYSVLSTPLASLAGLGLVALQPPPAPAAVQPVPPAAPAGKPMAPAVPRPQVPVVTYPQFEQAVQLAKLANSQNMPALSLRAIRDALRGGPPVPLANRDGRLGRVMYVGGTPPQSNQNEENTHAHQVEAALFDLVAEWRRHNVPVADIYETLAAVVLPEARPSEVFLYLTQLSGLGSLRYLRSTGRLLADQAVEAGRLDDLRRRAAARQGQPLGELTARILLAQASLAAKET